MDGPGFRAISSGQLSLGIAEPSNYSFILKRATEKTSQFFQTGIGLGIIAENCLKEAAAERGP
jgi:hypothetical protein